MGPRLNSDRKNGKLYFVFAIQEGRNACVFQSKSATAFDSIDD